MVKYDRISQCGMYVQVHLAKVKGRKMVVKVQRPGLRELFAIDCKNIRVLAEWLQKCDPSSDGASRDWVAIYDECQKILYQVSILVLAFLLVLFNRQGASAESIFQWLNVASLLKGAIHLRLLYHMEVLLSFQGLWPLRLCSSAETLPHCQLLKALSTCAPFFLHSQKPFWLRHSTA